MPKRSERVDFEAAFENNPYDGLSAEEIYKSLQWGKNPNEIIDVESPEPLANLGDLAGLYYDVGCEEFNENEVYLAVGAYSNWVYFIPKTFDTDIPEFDSNDKDWTQGPVVKETHYYSDKGNEESYYYHEHEKPYPRVWHHIDGVSVLIPANFKGKRSYAVVKEGIVG